MRIKVNPTRMQLLRLRRRLELARRGHKLLKDKLDGLVQEFLSAKKRYLSLNEKIESDLTRVFSKSVLAWSLSSPDTKFTPAAASVKTSTQNIMGIKIPGYTLEVEGDFSYDELLASAELDEALKGFSKTLPELVSFASLSLALRLLAKQIIETRQRVNALEYILIPELERNVKLILMKLSELERGARVVLIRRENYAGNN